jgi:replicative DNA helicase
MLSQFDETLHKQLIDYCVEKISANGTPIYTSINEHYIDAFGLAYLAFVLEFPELTNVVEKAQTTSRVEFVHKQLGGNGIKKLFEDISTNQNPQISEVLNYDHSDLPGDRPTMVKVPVSYRTNSSGRGQWGSRATGSRRSGFTGRTLW